MKSTRITQRLVNIDGHIHHPPYAMEQKLITEIKLGNLDNAMQTLHELNKLERPTLANDSLRSLKNGLIISCSLYTRAVIDAGIHPEDAFDQSDLFIKHIESMNNKRSLLEFDYEMLEQFILLLREEQYHRYPYPINTVVSYIKSNIASKLSVKSIAKHHHLSADYLSKLFTKEVGMPLSQFIQEEKVTLAKHFLEHTTLSVTDVSVVLEFSNPGHFSNIFKKHTSLSPSAFKKKYHG